jgi:acyl-CoA thioester hydrolase
MNTLAARPKTIEGEFTWPIRVYWEDTDAGGIVFYANYLKFFERARTEWLRTLGIGQQALLADTGGMFVVSDTQLKYHQPARLDDELTVTAGLIESGRVSLTIGQHAFKINSQKNTSLLCTASIKIGWVNATTMKPQRIPQAVLEALK